MNSLALEHEQPAPPLYFEGVPSNTFTYTVDHTVIVGDPTMIEVKSGEHVCIFGEPEEVYVQSAGRLVVFGAHDDYTPSILFSSMYKGFRLITPKTKRFEADMHTMYQFARVSLEQQRYNALEVAFKALLSNCDDRYLTTQFS